MFVYFYEVTLKFKTIINERVYGHVYNRPCKRRVEKNIGFARWPISKYCRGAIELFDFVLFSPEIHVWVRYGAAESGVSRRSDLILHTAEEHTGRIQDFFPEELLKDFHPYRFSNKHLYVYVWNKLPVSRRIIYRKHGMPI